MKLTFQFVVLAAALSLAPAASAEVRLTMANGHVSISATNATVTQILAEWARVGQTRIVNSERLAGGPMTIELTDVPEAQAIDILLRNASGYLLAQRAAINPAASRFDRILILPTSIAPRQATPPPTPYMPPRPNPVNMPDEDTVVPPVDRPAFVTFPQPGAAPRGVPPPPEPAPAPPSRVPVAPIGSARPGMPVPAPAAALPAPTPNPQ